MASTESPVRVRVEDGVGVVTLAGGHGNAIDPGLVAALRGAYRDLAADPAVLALLLRAEGKLFCPGLDLQVLLALDRDGMGAFMREFGDGVMEMFTFPKPVLAALHGHAVAGGCVFALTADWRISRRGAWIGLNEVRVGVPLPYGVARLVRESVAPSHRAEVALLGRNFRDEGALAAGLVHEIVEPERLEETCRERLAEFLSKDHAAIVATKRYLREEAARDMRAHDAARLPEWLDAWFSPGTRARIEAIVAGLSAGKR